MNSNRQLHLWPWVVFGCIVSVVNVVLGAIVLFVPCTIWVARKRTEERDDPS